ncbi:metallophosphoesterase [Paenibacillus abyssi]|uniref:Phosphoesterase n=1 Tax=Paenibacillus abyssi TaxID=1340531 RepID=A0A917LDH7_9BACL|nr:metallophosphoesterase [Paenibacillus abyssi]GGG14444.1 phosphoesterase [Paenibacillus abyssi]
MFIIIGIGIILLYALLVFYVGWSGWSWMKPKVSFRFKLLYIITLIIVSISFILGRVFGNITILNVIGAYWMAVFYLLILLLPVAHLSVWLFRLTPLPRHRVEKWFGFITMFTLIALIAYGSFNAYTPNVRTYDVHINKEVHDIESLNIVMASDMHFGLLSGKNHAIRMVEQINALQPDLVLFPGDILDDDIDLYLDKGIDQILSQIQSTYGVYASLGNHDRHDGKMEELIGVLENSNMQVLYDDTMTINDSFTLIGRKDYSDTERTELSALVKDLDPSKPLILLDHQPYHLDTAQQNGIDLMVSGHTHRGQIAPAHLITGWMYENDWGHLQKEQFHSIVSSGYGFWGPPIRIGSRSEIVQIQVTFGE